jgi:hypothetical protein
MTANLDQVSFDRITWLRHLSVRLLKSEAGTSVLIRRALMAYVAHIEGLLASHTQEQLERERALLSAAARGDTAALPDDDLLAVPPKPFTSIQQEAAEAARVAGLAKIRERLTADLSNWDHEGRRRGHG